MSFKEYGLSPEILSGLADVRIEQPTSLQQEVLTAALNGKNLLAQTSANDEATFLIPALQKITENGESSGTQVLILTPTIERAAKIDEMIWALGYHAQIGSALMAMKGEIDEQEKALLDGAPVIVANPGRFIDILKNNDFRLQQLKLIVIDEAHNMENFNLVSRVKDILKYVDNEAQTLILSERRNSSTEELVRFALKKPEYIGFEANTTQTQPDVSSASDVDLFELKEKLDRASVKVVLNPEEADEKTTEPTAVLQKASVKVVLKKDLPPKEEAEGVHTGVQPGGVETEPLAKELEQGFINVPPRMKISTLMAHLEESPARRVIVFAASGRTTDRLFRIIRKKSWGVVSISAELDKATFNERYERFKSREMRVLLVGGIPANQVEIEEVDEVINYDVPGEPEEYRYRAELVGGGKAARIISLVSKMDREDIQRISVEAGFSPVELPFPEELNEKMKKKAEPKKSNPRNKPTKGNKRGMKEPENRRSSGGNRNGKAHSNGRGRANTHPKAKKKETKPASLPRPTYDGLSGGREGSPEKSSRVFGWVKKLFK